MTTEQRVICATCGGPEGLFHKHCEGTWLVQTREVTEWQTTARRHYKTPDPSMVQELQRYLSG